ncbi:hypothetical protein BCE_2132 [Bacillus cereus ATCC 10987]|uniref:Uncharacterized protein n=1 Tax=Bacillus cereus (strain ATCC 10987 / NRS 248) TaxID=222523 RepID=Q739K8_BACC1|nr:hypothetical protein BCE_2132 [Bacillus cereus ATCC 10987]
MSLKQYLCKRIKNVDNFDFQKSQFENMFLFFN